MYAIVDSHGRCVSQVLGVSQCTSRAPLVHALSSDSLCLSVAGIGRIAGGVHCHRRGGSAEISRFSSSRAYRHTRTAAEARCTDEQRRRCFAGSEERPCAATPCARSCSHRVSRVLPVPPRPPGCLSQRTGDNTPPHGGAAADENCLHADNARVATRRGSCAY